MSLEDYIGIEHKYTINGFIVRQGSTQNHIIPPTNANYQEILNYLKTIYTNVFNCEGDSEGLNYWAEQITNG